MSSLVTGNLPARQAVLAKPSDALHERLVQRRLQKLGRQIGFYDWAMRVPEPKAGPLRFDLFPFQLELYKEAVHDKEAVVQKATQIGMSAYSIRWALYHADTRSRTALYVFPSARDMHDFSALRVKPVINGSSYLRLRKRPDDPNNRGMVGIGSGVVVMRGSESKTGLDSVDCDLIVFDEYDTLDHKNIPDAEMRVSSPLSPGLIRRIGVPSVPDWGISRLFDESDRRRWFVKCPHCGERQTLSFFDNLDLTTGTRICSKCAKSIEENIAAGEWVPEFLDGGRPRGYHVSRLIVPTGDMRKLIAASKKRSPTERTVFFNKHLGEPYVAAENRLGRDAIAAAQNAGGGYAMAPGYVGDQLVTMGIDVATVRNMNVRISVHLDEHTKRALWIGEANRFFEHEQGEGPSLEGLFKRFGVNMACIDHQPDGRLARQFAERFQGSVYVVSYDGTPNPRDTRVIKWDDEMLEVRVRRTAAIDAMMEAVRAQRNQLPINLPEGYVEQMGALVRVVEEDEFGKKTVVYRKIGDDDYGHAETYDLVAAECWLHRQMMESLLNEEVVTLDDELDFERSHLASYEQPAEYHAGGREDDPFWDH